MNLMMIMFMIILFIILLLFMLSMIISKKKYMEREKLSSFECGYDMIISSRLPFSIHFFLIGVLFLVFDIEIVLLFPIINSLNLLNFKNWLISSLMILLILYLGLEYEKNEGSLKWFL